MDSWTGDEIRGQLGRMLKSEAFVRSERLGRFLAYLVERRLAGENPGPKEYTLGVEVFGRGEGFDPRLDSIVRVEATRLRARLERYYATEGQGDRVRIELPRGGYTAMFRQQEVELGPGRLSVPAGQAGRWVWWVGSVVTLGLTLAAGIGIGMQVGKADGRGEPGWATQRNAAANGLR